MNGGFTDYFFLMEKEKKENGWRLHTILEVYSNPYQQEWVSQDMSLHSPAIHLENKS